MIYIILAESRMCRAHSMRFQTLMKFKLVFKCCLYPTANQRVENQSNQSELTPMTRDGSGRVDRTSTNDDGSERDWKPKNV